MKTSFQIIITQKYKAFECRRGCLTQYNNRNLKKYENTYVHAYMAVCMIILPKNFNEWKCRKRIKVNPSQKLHDN